MKTKKLLCVIFVSSTVIWFAGNVTGSEKPALRDVFKE
jgi:hypothetical protein